MSKEPKTAVFICRCGPNIYDKVNFEDLKDSIKNIPGVSEVYEDNFYCSPDGKKKIIDIIKNDKIDRCCFAACSHRVHEKTFMDTVEQAGLNPFLIQIANIREHITWVTDDKEKATKKAYDQIKAAIVRIGLQTTLPHKSMEALTDIAIIGGGIAGIKAAKLLARDKNRTIYLIEKEPTLGGWMPKWEKSYPGMDCNPCFLAPELSDMKDIKNIKVITSAEIENIKGFYGNFNLKITEKPRYINENCIGCMECFSVCPVTLKNEFNAGMNERNAVYLPYPGCYPSLAAIDNENCLRLKGEDCSKCKEVCDALFGAVDFDQKPVEYNINVGGIIVATGFDFIDIAGFPQYNYTGKDNIFTNYEFERMMSSSGPTGGHIKTRKNSDPENVGIVLCGGRKKYCSTVCCGASMKYAKFLLDHNKGIKIKLFYSELCLSDEGLQTMYNDLQKEQNVEFIKTDDYNTIRAESITDEKVKISYYQNKVEKSDEVNLAVISMGIKNSEASKKISELLDLSVTNDGWFTKYHHKMEPSTSNVEGVYLAGSCINPLDVQKSVASAKGAAGEAMSKLIKGAKIELEIKVSYITEDKCGGCKLCISVCPYKAIDYNSEKESSEVNEVLCKGCGTCVALCPAGAIKNYHFENDQIESEIDSLVS